MGILCVVANNGIGRNGIGSEGWHNYLTQKPHVRDVGKVLLAPKINAREIDKRIVRFVEHCKCKRRHKTSTFRNAWRARGTERCAECLRGTKTYVGAEVNLSGIL
jgi:hypothetical protein